HDARHRIRVADIGKSTLNNRIDASIGEQIRSSNRWQRKTEDFRTHAMKPQTQPRALESGMAQNKNALFGPKVRRRGHLRFHGGLPLFQSSSSSRLSRSVSMACQKPL